MRRRRGLSLALIAMLASTAVVGCHSSPRQWSSPLVVYLDQHATAEQRAAVEQRLRAMPKTRDVTFQSKGEAYQNFKRMLSAAPSLSANTEPESLPASFTATVDSTLVEAISAVMKVTPGVIDTDVTLPEDTNPRDTVGLALLLEPNTTEDQTAPLRTILRALPDAKPAKFESADAARTRLKARCKGEPTLVAALKATTPHASYRFTFTITAKSYGSADYQKLADAPGVVSQVFLPASAL